MKIALYHNLPSGGAKRSLYETVRRLTADYHNDVHTLSTADESFCDLRPFVNKYEMVTFKPSCLFSSPLGRLNQVQRWRDLYRLDQLARRIADEIDTQLSARVHLTSAQTCGQC